MNGVNGEERTLSPFSDAKELSLLCLIPRSREHDRPKPERVEMGHRDRFPLQELTVQAKCKEIRLCPKVL